MRASLIVGTISSERRNHLRRFLDSLTNQTYRDFEIVIIDQSRECYAAAIVNEYQNRLTIRYVRSQPGLSRARNAGLEVATGDFLAFPDDDCWYFPNTLRAVVETFASITDTDGVLAASVDEMGRRSVMRGLSAPAYVDLKSVLRTAASITMFLRTTVVKRLGGFDETLGLGSGTPWNSGEDTDLAIRILRSGGRLYYNPSVQVGHAQQVQSLERAYNSSGRVGGYLLALYYPSTFFWFDVLPRRVAKVVLKALQLDRQSARQEWTFTRALLHGWGLTKLELRKRGSSMQ